MPARLALRGKRLGQCSPWSPCCCYPNSLTCPGSAASAQRPSCCARALPDTLPPANRFTREHAPCREEASAHKEGSRTLPGSREQGPGIPAGGVRPVAAVTSGQRAPPAHSDAALRKPNLPGCVSETPALGNERRFRARVNGLPLHWGDEDVKKGTPSL